MGKAQPLLQPSIVRGKSWHIEWYFENQGQRIRIRKSRFNNVDLNAIANPEEREQAALAMLQEFRARLCPPVLEPDQEIFFRALDISLQLKRSEKTTTNKSYAEVVRWLQQYFTARGWQYLRCNQVTPDHIQEYFDSLIVDRRVKNSTYNTRKNNLRAVFTALVKRKCFPTNYVSMVPNRKAADPIRRPLSEREKKIVANHIVKHDRALTLAYLLLCYMAIRPGEMRNLRVSAIDLDRGVVRFPSRDSKNNHNSVVTIPKQIIPILKTYKFDEYPETHYLFGAANGRHNLNLLPRAERIGANTLSGRFRTLIRQLHDSGQLGDITGIQFYSLKDTLAIYLLDNGIDLESAMRHFRHGDLQTFQRYVKRLGVINEPIRALDVDFEV
jgi:integrase